MNKLFKFKIHIFLIHFYISLSIGILVVFTLFWKFYPPPFYFISGGLSIFLLLIVVNIILGPVLTFVVANGNKSSNEFRQDMLIVIVIQTIALFYGIHAAYLARPVFAVLEVDRIRVVSAAEIDEQDLINAPSDLQRLPIGEIKLIGLRNFIDNDEKMNSIELALKGRDVSVRPEMWAKWSDKDSLQVLKRGFDWEKLSKHHPSIAKNLEDFSINENLNKQALLVLPMQARSTNTSAVFDSSGRTLLGYIKGDLLEN